MTLAFSKKSVDEADEDWKKISEFNAALQRLALRRKSQVDPVDDKIWPSKVAWKVETFTQVVLHRLIALCAGTISAWEEGHPLASILSARAVMETAAFLWDFSVNLEELCKARDFNGISDFTDQKTFAVREKEWLKSFGEDAPKFTQINVLTFLQRMDKKLVPGLWGHYERLSEMCHPNSAGHYMFFANLNHETAIVTMGDGFFKEKQLFNAVIGDLISAQLCESIIDQIDNLIPIVIELSEIDRKGTDVR